MSDEKKENEVVTDLHAEVVQDQSVIDEKPIYLIQTTDTDRDLFFSCPK